MYESKPPPPTPPYVPPGLDLKFGPYFTRIIFSKLHLVLKMDQLTDNFTDNFHSFTDNYLF